MSNPPSTEERLREKISKILVKWGMPTRQVAINELLELHRAELQSLIDKVDSNMKETKTAGFFATSKRNQVETHIRNETLSDIKVILEEVKNK